VISAGSFVSGGISTYQVIVQNVADGSLAYAFQVDSGLGV